MGSHPPRTTNLTQKAKESRIMVFIEDSWAEGYDIEMMKRDEHWGWRFLFFACVVLLGWITRVVVALWILVFRAYEA